jgi:U4/U6 small nuclear ribonucleoprotein PRP31
VLLVKDSTCLDKIDFSLLLSLEAFKDQQHKLMALQMVAVSSKGRQFGSEQECLECTQLATNIIQTWEQCGRLQAFVAERLSSLAPNMCALVGPQISAKLLTAVGGLKELAACPANNLQVIGRDKSSKLSFHAGFIAESDLLDLVPGELMSECKKVVVRLVAAKLALAIRADFVKSHSDNGALGSRLRQEIVGKIEKRTEPLPYKIDKPLPPPIVHSKKQRGGKRARRLKEQVAMTAVRRQQNRIAFGVAAEDELVIGEKVVGRGMLGAPGTARITMVDGKLRERVKRQSERALTGIYANRGEQSNPFAFDANTALLLKK